MTNEQQPNIVATVPAPRRSSKGIVKDIKEAIFGVHDEHAAAIKELKRHGALFRAVAHWFSYIMLALFSAQGVLAQVSDDAKAVWISLQAHQTPDFYKVLTVLIVAGFNIGLDIALIAMFEEIRHKHSQGEKWPHPGGPVTFVVIGSIVEGATYLVVVLGIHEWRVTLFLLVLRAGMLPFVVNVLATLTGHPFSVKDFQQWQAIRFSHYLNDWLNHLFSLVNVEEIDGGALVSGYSAVNELTEAQAAQMRMFASAVTAIVPANIRAREREAFNAELAQKESQWQAEMVKMQAAYQQQSAENARMIDHINHLETSVNDARIAAQTARHEAGIQAESELGIALQKVLLSLAYQQRLPDDIVERYPDLSNLNVEGMFSQSRGHSRNNASAKVAKETPDNAEGQRAFLTRILRDVAIKGVTIGTPTSRKGVWITPAVITVLSGGKVNESTAHSIVKTLNKGDKSAKIGTAYAAPFVEVMRYLSSLDALSAEARTFWSSEQDSAEDTPHIHIA